jgi:hypothetical protein
LDKVTNLWVDKNRRITSLLPESSPEANDSMPSNVESLPPRGWALKESPAPTRKDPEVKQFLDNIWQAGECSGMKADAVRVAELMRSKTTSDGTRMFSTQQWLSARQIMSYFSRLTAIKNLPNMSEDLVNDIMQDLESAQIAENTNNLLYGL